MPDTHKRRLQKAALGFDVKKIEPVDCYEVADRAKASSGYASGIVVRMKGEALSVVGDGPVAFPRPTCRVAGA